MPSGNVRMHIIKGELRTMAPAGYEHGDVITNFALLLAMHVKAKGLGRVSGAETGFVLKRQSGHGFWCRHRLCAQTAFLPAVVRRNFFKGAPDLAVEVLLTERQDERS